MMMTWGLLGVGLVLLLVGGDALVRGAVVVGGRLGLTPLVIGMVIVGFGTSTPELFVSVQAGLREASGIAVGNVIGSNIANILLILGATALFRPITRPKHFFITDSAILLAVTGVFLTMAYLGRIEAWQGLVLIGLLAVFIMFQVLRCLIVPAAAADADTPAASGHAGMAIVLMLSGFVALWYGSDLLVTSAVIVARDLGVSDELVGITIIAVGTSLPELASALAAAWRGHGNVAYGSIVGSNIFNILGILGVAASVRPLTFPAGVLAFDGPVVLGTAVVMLIAMSSGRGIGRTEGLAFLILYVAYIAFRANLDGPVA